MSDDSRTSDAELDRLYQQQILEHNRDPRGWGAPAGADRRAEADNPFCGDRVVVHARLDGDLIAEVGFTCESCAILKASASMMTVAVRGKRFADVEALFACFQRVLHGKADQHDESHLGPLVALRGVSAFPVRIACATLPWTTLLDLRKS
jgi:nitrogen fixation NifU-like protein